MKREVAFFKDKRARLTNGAALIAAMRAVGMTDDEIKAALLKTQSEQQAQHKDTDTQETTR